MLSSAHKAIRTFWDTRPCNIRHSAKQIGTRKYFDEVEQRKYFVEPHILPFADFPAWKGKKVLEIGCGLGTESINFARNGAEITVVDLSPVSLELCRKRFDLYGLSAHFVLANAENIGNIFGKDAFDLVWAWGSVHHTLHPDKIIKGVHRILKPTGELRMMVYSKVSYKMFWIMHTTNEWDMTRCDDVVREHAEAQVGCPIARTYTFDEIKDLLSDYTILDMHKDHIFIWDVDKYIRYEYEPDKAWGGIGEKDLRNLERELGWHTLVRAKPNK